MGGPLFKQGSTVDMAVVIPTWNGKALLAECLGSLRRQQVRPAEIIVVDDGSTDGTAAFVRANYAEARVIALEENRGFCVAVNAGIAAARATWLFLLNNDMTLAPDCLARLMEATRQAPAALYAPVILWRDQPDVVYSAGDLQLRNGRPEPAGFNEPLATFPMPEHIFGVCAGAGLYHRSVFERVGAFDPVFNVYFSDSDVSFRAQLAGFDACLVPDARTYHVGSASLGGRTWKRTRQCFINHALLLAKNMPGPLLVKHAPAILGERVHQARRVFSAARAERGAVYAVRELAAAWLEMMRLLRGAMRQRRAIQRLRTRPAVELDKRLAGD